MTETFDHQPLDLVCTNTAMRARFLLMAAHQSAANVVPIAVAPADRIGRRHEVAAVVEDQSAKERSSLEPRPASCSPISFEPGLNRTPQFLVDDPLVLTGIGNALVDDLAQVDPVLQ